MQNLKLVLSHATVDDFKEGIAWYQDAHNFCVDLVDLSGDGGKLISVEQACAVVAYLSPRNKWETNKADARRMVSAHCLGLDLMGVVVSTFSANKLKAANILNGEGDVSQLTKEAGWVKVPSFYWNMLHPELNSAVVTIDIHAYRAWSGVGLTDDLPKLTPKRYNTCAQSYCELAELHGILPHEMQAIIWVVQRRLTANGDV